MLGADTGNTVMHELPTGSSQWALYVALRDAGADITARNFSGRTPLHCAAAAGDVALARLLLQDGASASAPAAGGETPMHAAAAAEDVQAAPEVVRWLAEHGGIPDAADDCGVTPMDIARSRGFAQGQPIVVRAFEYRDADLSSTVVLMSVFLHWQASARKRERICSFWLLEGCESQTPPKKCPQLFLLVDHDGN